MKTELQQALGELRQELKVCSKLNGGLPSEVAALVQCVIAALKPAHRQEKS